MEEKYYIPDLKEFRVGFEYEQTGSPLYPHEHWDKRIYTYCNNGDLSYIQMNIINKYIRVKYLDHDDIISLNFNFSHDVYVKNCGDRLLSLVIKDDKIRICEMSNSDKYKVLFYGKIKNKSELKDILEKI